MRSKTKLPFIVHSICIFWGLPLFILYSSELPEASPLQTTFSLITILAFFLLTGQFFWSRNNKYATGSLKMNHLKHSHNFLGYLSIFILLIHPLFLIIPRFFESGLTPLQALITITTTFTSRGILLGYIAWSLMVILGLTSLVRRKLPIQYTTWRTFHGLLSALFIIVATWHVVNISRHANLFFSITCVVFAISAVLLLFRSYLTKSQSRVGITE